MLRTMFKSKIHMAVITQTELEYHGSITLPEDLLEAADIFPGERVQVVNMNNGDRLETYTIAGPRGSGHVCLNGPAARRGMVGDRVTVISYCMLPSAEAKALQPRVLILDANNRVRETI